MTKNGQEVRLGGALSQATTISTTALNTLAISGLQSGSVNDSILVINPINNVIRRISPSNSTAPKTVKTTTSQTVTGSTLVTANTLQFGMTANKTYKVKLFLVYNTSATNNGITLALNAITGNIWYEIKVQTSTSGVNDYFTGYNNTSANISGSCPGLTNNVAVIEALVQPTSNGTFTFSFAASSGGGIRTITIQPNSILEYWEVN